MSEGGRSKKPGQQAQIEAPETADAKVTIGGLVEADRSWAQQRIAGFFQGQRIHRAAKAGGEQHEHGGAEVSEPHEAAEVEADKAADHVADALHDGGDKAGAKDAAAGPAHAAPPIGAKLKDGVVINRKKGDDKGKKDDKAAGGSKKKDLPDHPDKSVTIENGKYVIKETLRGMIREKFYGTDYRTDVKKWMNQMLTTPKSKGGLRHGKDSKKYWFDGKYYEDAGGTKATIGHEHPPVAQHWNDKGHATTQDRPA